MDDEKHDGFAPLKHTIRARAGFVLLAFGFTSAKPARVFICAGLGKPIRKSSSGAAAKIKPYKEKSRGRARGMRQKANKV